jgi:hypothetical protein
VSGDAGRLTSALTDKLFTQRLHSLLTAYHIFVLVLLLLLCLPPLRFQLCCRLLPRPSQLATFGHVPAPDDCYRPPNARHKLVGKDEFRTSTGRSCHML